MTQITEIIPMSPNADPNERIRFQISSNNPDEYVHLKECELSKADQEDNINLETSQTFIRDGCVEKDFTEFVENSDREVFANEDLFNMRPFISGCKTKWHIKCKTASCKRGLKSENKDAFKNHCSIPDTCSRSYYAEFLDPNHTRRRRSSDDTGDFSVDEAVVEAVLEHPCYNVDAQKPTYCNSGVCWNLSECAAMFPNDFPDYTPKYHENAKLNTIIGLLESFFANEESMTDEIENQADVVLTAVKTVEEGVEKLREIVTNTN